VHVRKTLCDPATACRTDACSSWQKRGAPKILLNSLSGSKIIEGFAYLLLKEKDPSFLNSSAPPLSTSFLFFLIIDGS